MILAVGVMLVITLAVLALLGSVISGQNLTRNDQNRTNAFQYANAGIDQALWRIDNAGGAPAAIPATLSGGLYGFDDTITVGGSTFAVHAEQATAGQTRVWTVRSTGTDPSGRRRTAIATIEAKGLFDNGFFTLHDFSVTGSQGSPTAYRSSICLDPFNPSSGCVFGGGGTPIDGYLGTNSYLFQGGLSAGRLTTYENAWKGFRFYGKGSLAAARPYCAPDSQGVGQCRDEKISFEPEAFDVSIPPRPGSTRPCPTLRQRTGVDAIDPGDYYCPTGLQLGTDAVNKSDEFIRVATSPACPATTSDPACDVRIWVDNAFSVASQTFVNQRARPQRFQVYQPCRPSGSGCDPAGWGGSLCEQSGQIEIWALLFIPGTAVSCGGGSQPLFVGSVVADFYNGSGNQFDFVWDMDGKSVGHNGRFVVKSWRECPPGATDC